jgi:hypothetical protein
LGRPFLCASPVGGDDSRSVSHRDEEAGIPTDGREARARHHVRHFVGISGLSGSEGSRYTEDA